MGEMTGSSGPGHDPELIGRVRSERQPVFGKDHLAVGQSEIPTTRRASRTTLVLLVAMNGIAPVSLYMLVPMLPQLAALFSQDISIAQMTVSLYMVGMAFSQL